MYKTWISHIKTLSNCNILDKNESLNTANLLLENIFVFTHPYSMEPCDVRVFMQDSYWHSSPNGDPEWIYMLKRQEYLIDLLHSFYVTDNSQFLLKIKELICNWINNNINSHDIKETSRTIDTGIRLLNWSVVIPILQHENLFDASELATINQAIKTQIQYLLAEYNEKYDLSNWGVLITTGILVISNELENIYDKEIVIWAEQKLLQQLNLQVTEDGLHWEQSPLYFLEIWRSVLAVYTSYLKKGKYLSNNLKICLLQMHKASNYFIRPNGLLIQQGDTDAVEIDSLYQASAKILNAQETGYQFKHIFDFLIVELSHNIELFSTNKLPQDGNILPLYKDSHVTGNYFYRSNWESAASFWHIYNGYLSSGHGHAALGHIDLSINGSDIFIDPGRYTYCNNQDRLDLKSVYAHNTIVINETPFTEPKETWAYNKVARPLNNYVQHSNEHEYISIQYIDEQEYGRYAIITRNYIWLKEHYIWCILDFIQFDDNNNQVDTYFQLSPDLKIQLEQDKIVLTKNSNRYCIYTNVDSIKVEDALYSPKYNILSNTKRIKTHNKFKKYLLNYTIIDHNDTIISIKSADIRQQGSDKKVELENCFGINIELATRNIIIAYQALNTFQGSKLYFVDNIPVYGELNITCINKESIGYKTDRLK